MGILSVTKQCLCFQGIQVFFLFVCSFVSALNNSLEEAVYNNPAKYGVFYSLQSLLDTLKSEMYRNDPSALELLKSYEYCVSELPQQTKPKNHPFIVIEGNSKSGKRVLAYKIASTLGAKLVNSVPICLQRKRYLFRHDWVLSRIYFTLTVYVSGKLAENMLDSSPVVLHGYWMDQATFHLAKDFTGHKLPDDGSMLYKFPEDLLKPDAVFYFCTKKEFIELSPRVQSLNNMVAEIYRRMRDPVVTSVNATHVGDEEVLVLKKYLSENLKTKYPMATYL